MTFDKRFSEAIKLEQSGRYKEAEEAFAGLADGGGERAWEALWHQGINTQRLHAFSESKDLLVQAREMAPDEVARANVARDLAETLSALWHMQGAERVFSSSLAVLDPGYYPVEHAATRGMLVRHLLRVDKPEQAVVEGRAAVELLERHDNPLQLLYALLNLADAQLLAGDPKGSQETAERARPLAKQASRKHRLRAWLLAKGFMTRPRLVDKYSLWS